MIRLIRFFVDNYVLTFSAFGALMLFGVISILNIGVDLLPPIEVPIVAVSTTYPGAGPEEISRQVSEPIEGALNTLPGITSVSSVSSEGISFVIAQFEADLDVDQAAIDVSQRVNGVVGQLPSDASHPAVQKFDPADEPILYVALAAPGFDLTGVQAFAEDELAPYMQRVQGVADVSVVGPAAREIQVLLDPGQLILYGLTPTQVVNAIQASALDVPAGSVTLDSSRVLLTGRSTPESISDIERIRVDPVRGLRVADVATVRDGRAQVETFARVNGEPVVLLEVRKVSGSNSVAAADELEAALAQYDLPEGYEAQIFGDTTEYIAATVNDTILEMLLAAIAVSLIVLMFVGRLGTVFAVVLAIPVSIAGVLVMFALLGYTFNIVTLLAITVAIGLVVDDAIVVAENIDQYRERGYGLRESVLKGAGSVSTAVLAATLSLLAVFLPISFLPGIIGQFFAQFGLTLAAAIAFSYLEAMFFLTVRLALAPDPLPPTWRQFGQRVARTRDDFGWLWRLLRRPLLWLAVAVAAGLLWWLYGPLYAPLALLLPVALFVVRVLWRVLINLLGALAWSLYALGDVLIRAGRRAYVGSLRALLKRPVAVLAVAALMFASVFFIFPRIGYNFIPPMDTGQLVASVEMPTGTTLEATNRVTSEVEELLRSHPAVDVVQVSVGTGGLLGQAASDSATLIVELVDPDQREIDTVQLVAQLQQGLPELMAQYPGSEVIVTNASDAFVGVAAGGLAITLASNDLDLLQERGAQAVEVLRDMEGVVNVDSDVSELATERVFVVEPSLIDGTGLVVADIYNALRTYNVGAQATRLRSGGEDLPVIVMGAPTALGSEQALLSLPVYSPALQSSLPLGELGYFETRAAPGIINRLQQEYSVGISADVLPGYTLSLVQEEARQNLIAAGVIDDQVREQTEGILDLLGDLTTYGPIAFGLALLLNYLAIGSQFNSFRYPIYLLLTVPLALVGAVWLFFLTGTSLDVISVLGVVMLIGLVTKNAILLLDAALTKVREDGTNLFDALVYAGGVRFRPIIMTTVTVIVISVPLLLGLGEGSELRYPLGMVILGGVTTSALLTFYVVPAAFYLFERKRIERRFDEDDDGLAAAADTDREAATSGGKVQEAYTG